MKAVFAGNGDLENLSWDTIAIPKPRYKEVLIKADAYGVNRVDLLQNMGNYPLPSDFPEVLGVEVSGTIVETGNMVNKYSVGQRVCALVDGGAYAEYCLSQEGTTMFFESPSSEEMAAIPETFITSYQALHSLARLQGGDRVLIHAGGGAVGSTALQMAKHSGAEVFVTCSKSKSEVCERLGADLIIDYESRDFSDMILDHTDGAGVDVIIDLVGGAYFQNNMDVISTDGRWVIVGLLGKNIVKQVDLSTLLFKRVQLLFTTLRTRSYLYKHQLVSDFLRDYTEAVEEVSIRPLIDSVLPWQDTSQAFLKIVRNQAKGKIVCRVN